MAYMTQQKMKAINSRLNHPLTSELEALIQLEQNVALTEYAKKRLEKLLKNAEKAPKLRNTKCLYFLCPDSKCKLFTKLGRHVPCDHECPKQAKKAIVCWNCKKVIILDYEYSIWIRIDCECGASIFQMRGIYRRYNLK